MAHYTMAPSGALIDAFQWNGGNLASYTLPNWARNLSMQTTDNYNLCVPCWNGITSTKPTEWVFKASTGSIHTLGNNLFNILFTSTP